MLGSARCVDVINATEAKGPYHELGRVSSPDGQWDAVLTERGTHATVATPSEVFILPRGTSVSGEPVWLADHAIDVELKWTEVTALEIYAEQARTFNFQPEVTLGSQRLTVRLLVARNSTSSPTDGRLARAE